MIDLINRILEEGRDNDDLGAILENVSEGLVALGIPVCRTTLNMPTIDPAAGVLSFQWSREKGVMRSTFAPGVSSGTQFRRSPIGYLVERNIGGERWKLEDPEVVGRFPLFQELRGLGITEYALQVVPFSKRRTGLQGAALSMATDRPGDFSDAEIEEAARILPALSLVAYRIGLLHVATETLGAYLGPQTGARVLQGKDPSRRQPGHFGRLAARRSQRLHGARRPRSGNGGRRLAQSASRMHRRCGRRAQRRGYNDLRLRQRGLNLDRARFLDREG